MVVMDAKAAQQAILSSTAPGGLTIKGRLSLLLEPALKRLPDDLQVDELSLGSCRNLKALPKGLRCGALTINQCPITDLPADLRVSHTLILDNCKELEALPAGLSVQRLMVQHCPKIKALPADLRVTSSLEVNNWPQLEALPEELHALSLDISGCTGLTGWPKKGPRIMQWLNMRGCTGLRSLPPWLFKVHTLDISNCVNLRELPGYLRANQIEIFGSGVRRLPRSCQDTQLLWRGVPISPEAAFHPETMKARAILKEQNTEIRRVLLERMGYERFVAEARATPIDRDTDAGGLRRLLRVPLGNDEPLVYLSVLDPSTGRQYLLRVPPHMQTCHQAAAWIAGFDNPHDYHPVAET